MHIFTQGFEGQTQMFLDASARRHMKTKYVEVKDLVENMSHNEYMNMRVIVQHTHQRIVWFNENQLSPPKTILFEVRIHSF